MVWPLPSLRHLWPGQQSESGAQAEQQPAQVALPSGGRAAGDATTVGDVADGAEAGARVARLGHAALRALRVGAAARGGAAVAVGDALLQAARGGGAGGGAGVEVDHAASLAAAGARRR